MKESSSKPDVTVVIPTYEGARWLEETLSSVRETSCDRGALGIVVVDNASTDGTEALVRKFGGSQYVRLEKNLGFAGACMEGARRITSPLVAFLNNDVRVAPDWLDRLMDALFEGKDLIASGARVLNWTGRRVLFNGGRMDCFGFGIPQDRGKALEEVSADASERGTLFPCGVAMVARREEFLELGGFDRDYFAYYEDVDFGWRSWICGYRVLHVPAAVVYHRESMTRKKLGRFDRSWFLGQRNSLYTAFKNYEETTLQKVLPAALMHFLKRAVRYAGADRWDPSDWTAAEPWSSDGWQKASRNASRGFLLLAVLDAFFSDLPLLWKKRKEVQGRRKRSDAELFPLFGHPLSSLPGHLRPNLLGEDFRTDFERPLLDLFGIFSLFSAVDSMAGYDTSLRRYWPRGLLDLYRELEEFLRNLRSLREAAEQMAEANSRDKKSAPSRISALE